MGGSQLEEALKYKDEGNEAFKTFNYTTALNLYTKSINLITTDSKDLAICYKNRAAAYLKLERYEDALSDCNRSLDIQPNDPKALYRRFQALEALQRYEEAYRDATQIFKDDPSNKPIQTHLARLFAIVQERDKLNAQTTTKIDAMTKIAFDLAEPLDKRETAINNLLVLARDRNAAEIIIKQTTIVQQIKKLLKIEKNQAIYVTGVRIVGELVKQSPVLTVTLMRDVGIPWFLEIIDSNDEKRVNSAQYCIQQILNTFSGLDTKKPDLKPNAQLCAENKQQIDTILTCLVYSINNRLISGLARDAIIELVMKNVHYDALNWSEQLVELGGIEKLLECTSELEEFSYESAISVTSSTSTIASVCLSRIYDNMYYDQAKATYMSKIEDFIKAKLLSPDHESKIRCTVAITALLRGPLDVGNQIIAKDGIIEMILVMANSSDVLQQKVACECIIAAASKADKARTIIASGVPILKQLYKSNADAIRVRALVGLCKLGSSGGNDSSIKPFADGATTKLAEACRRFLLSSSEPDVRKWAAEGLSYLTLDADVKEKLIEDRPALKALIKLAQTGDQSCLFGVVTTLVNLCNAYEKQEVIPEMIELAKFAKQHIPEEHELDDYDFVTKRILALGHEGVTTALVALAKTESPNSLELISRVFNALCSEQELRGEIVQQGGTKALLPLALKGTDRGRRQASQALARIAITINPAVAFPGQRALEVIRPLLALLHADCTGLENFEALMALCNIAQMSETARRRILSEGGLSKIEAYMYEDHEFLCRAATQAVTNLTMSEEVVRVYEGENDRVKMLVGLCLDADAETAMAAGGALAILTGCSEKCGRKVFDSKSWLEALHRLLAGEEAGLQYRGVCIVRNLVEVRELAERLFETDVMEILMALTKLEGGDRQVAVEVARKVLAKGVEFGFIEKPPTSSGI